MGSITLNTGAGIDGSKGVFCKGIAGDCIYQPVTVEEGKEYLIRIRCKMMSANKSKIVLTVNWMNSDKKWNNATQIKNAVFGSQDAAGMGT